MRGQSSEITTPPPEIWMPPAESSWAKALFALPPAFHPRVQLPPPPLVIQIWGFDPISVLYYRPCNFPAVGGKAHKWMGHWAH